jgi:hypothetical protein
MLQAENEALRHRLDAIEKKLSINTASMPTIMILALCCIGLGGWLLRRRATTGTKA